MNINTFSDSQLLIELAVNLTRQLDRLNQPLIQALFPALFSALCLCWRRYRMAAGLLALGALWLWLCATPAFATWLQRSLEQQYPQMDAAAYPTADAILVLGGGDVPRSDVDWNDDQAETQATRIGFGLQLFQKSRAVTVLLSGDDEALRMTKKLQQQGVPAGALQTENASTTTHQNALYSAAMLKRENLQRILLVTSPMHMPRAVACFRRQGLTVIPAPAPDPNHDLRQASYLWWPHGAALHLSARCLHEYFGLWIYKLRGWA